METVSRHRRSRIPRRIAVGALTAAVLGAGGLVAVIGLASDGCAEPATTLTVAASPDQYEVVRGLALEWNANEPTAAGRCAQITVGAMPAGFAAATLGPDWDETREGTRPDVWLPDSSAWLWLAAGRPEAAAMLPPAPPSLASSPVVMAMRRPMAVALGWPDARIGWIDLVDTFSDGRTWQQFDHPQWGPLELGMADPTKATAGLATVLAVFDPDYDQSMTDEELYEGIAFAELVSTFEEDTGALLRPFTRPAGEGLADLPAAFPVLERDLARHLAAGGSVPLVPVYPSEGVVVADYPFVLLDAPWVDQPRKEIADSFLDLLTGPAGRRAYRAAGFRNPRYGDPGTGLLSPDLGFTPQLSGPVRVPSAAALDELVGVWGALHRPYNVLIVLDTSGSMDEPVPDTGLTRLELLRQAAIEGITRLTDQTSVGLWEFSSELAGTTPYRVLVPFGPAAGQLDGTSRRQAMIAAVEGLTPNRGTGLYDTVHDAYLRMGEAWQPDTQNLLVIITDGRDEDHVGRGRDELLDALEAAVDPRRPLPVIAIAVGPEADAASLSAITEVTGGRTFVARDDVSAVQQVVLAFAGRIS